ncbi:MAG: hypothetical protein KF757_09825 [Phycisphaeraceae bacterium]|nr:hypothetical protein [Phycisphaeraceae bacterium]MCW5763510.1 hypothetical protein [Phycisphaeraceae bacterium]
MMKARQIVGSVAAGLLLAGAGGCSTMKVTGRVIPGTISYVGVVSDTDERLSNAGIGPAKIMIEHSEASGQSRAIATGTSGPDGQFSIKMSKDVWPTDRVVVRSISEQYRTARGVVYLPRDGQKLLILMERTASD